MNQHVRPPAVPPGPTATQVADGLPRRAWTVDEVHRMMEAGIVKHGEKFELIGGELVAMAAKGPIHEDLKTALMMAWGKVRPPELKIGQETPLQLDDYSAPEPEFIVYPASIRRRDVRGDTVLLVIEVADSSLGYDHKFKGPRYAAAGVREYWVIAAREQITTIYRDPGPDGYASRIEMQAGDLLTPHLAPSLALRLSELDVD